MWTAILAAINWLSSGAFTAIANGVVNVLNKRTDANIKKIEADEAVDTAQIQAAVPIVKAQADIYQQRWGWWGTRYMALAAAFGPIIHANAVYLDSTFCNDALHTCTRIGLILGMPWRVPAAPGGYGGLETEIILGCVGILTVGHIFGRR